MRAIAPETWVQQSFGSGTQIVTSGEPGKPWLYILARIRDDAEDMSVRHFMCRDLAAYLNGGDRPDWLADMERVSEERIVGVDGCEIEAVGPLYDADPPGLNWKTRIDDEAVSLRARLIDLVWNRRNIPEAEPNV